MTMHNAHMKMAVQLATKASLAGEVPVAAIVVDGNNCIVAHSTNRVQELGDATAHAEILAIRQACQTLKRKYLATCSLYVTLEPCTMCAGAIAHARLERVFFGAHDPKGGAIDHGARVFFLPTMHHKPQIIGGMEESLCKRLLKTFFRERRNGKSIQCHR